LTTGDGPTSSGDASTTEDASSSTSGDYSTSSGDASTTE
jgi:hypothetical protein